MRLSGAIIATALLAAPAIAVAQPIDGLYIGAGGIAITAINLEPLNLL